MHQARTFHHNPHGMEEAGPHKMSGKKKTDRTKWRANFHCMKWLQRAARKAAAESSRLITSPNSSKTRESPSGSAQPVESAQEDLVILEGTAKERRPY
eukprot:4226648-Heterocapsa_arctica.AAC.1